METSQPQKRGVSRVKRGVVEEEAGDAGLCNQTTLPLVWHWEGAWAWALDLAKLSQEDIRSFGEKGMSEV